MEKKKDRLFEYKMEKRYVIRVQNRKKIGFRIENGKSGELNKQKIKKLLK